jgi:hypothetical protein
VPLLLMPDEVVLAVAGSGDRRYAYVSTPFADGTTGGAIVRFNAAAEVHWRRALPDLVVATTGTPALAADGEVVVVAGGEELAVLDSDTGAITWRESVVSLAKSRGYALPGAIQHIAISDRLVYLSATPGGLTTVSD